MSHGRVYLLAEDGDTEAVFEKYDLCQWRRRLWNPSALKMRINRYDDNALLLDVGRVVLVNDDPGELLPFVIESAGLALDEEGRASETLEVLAVEYGFHEQRICLPPPFDLPATSYEHAFTSDPAETAMLGLVDANMGPGAIAARRLDDLNVDTDGGRGTVGSYRARYHTVEERLSAIGQVGELGWEVVRDPGVAGEFLFRVIEGTDRTATVFFDPAFDSALAQRWLRSYSDLKTVAYVAGQGEGIDRTVVATWLGASEPTGRDRRELFVDARDIEDESSPPGDTTALEQRGKEKLAEQQAEDAFETEVNPIGSFRYQTHWNLGDVVTVRNASWDIVREARIIEVERTRARDEADRITVVLGKAIPTIKSRVLQTLGAGGSQRA